MNEDSYRALLDDLRAEGDDLFATLFELNETQWQLDTPAVGWNIHDQVVHLAFFDEMAALALTRPAEFHSIADAVLAIGDDWIDRISYSRRSISPIDLLDTFVRSRAGVIATFIEVGSGSRGPWFGPPMSGASSATARLMETWAHGRDIYDTLGRSRLPTQRVRHICHLGVLTRRFAYQLRGLAMPEVDIRVELVAPDGRAWTWGADGATDLVTGDAGEFALLVTQRVHLDDTNLLATPGPAAEWLGIAQAFAGTVGPGRPSSRKSTHRERG